ncbi:glutathionylspermidine synthase family protein [Agromyces humi]|uniref:glutathionylspermidine synthase family protein n=1 Tax=Agromyces humi TaxID=1766800 RepID=UPI001939901A|nr:glutathionylspermidine synthase family protein [Agromyces humi]
MIRTPSKPRPEWRSRFDSIGFTFYDMESEGGRPYWQEEAAYGFTLGEVDALEAVTKELFGLCMEAVEHIVRNGRFAEFGIPTFLHELVARSWDEDDPTVYGRFDLAYDGGDTIKMLEFNADTPTSLVESAAAQWQWLVESRGEDADQFNAIHELLVEQWEHIRTERLALPAGARLHLASLHNTGDGELIVEDADTVGYMAETAKAAGFDTKQIFMEDVQFDVDRRRFIDSDGEPIERIFKLYPWEWMVREQFAELLTSTRDSTVWIEPIWKMLLSNKQLLVVLWELFPGHPNLLPAYTSQEMLAGREYVSKPKLGREGANVTIYDQGGRPVAQQGGEYGEEGFVFQERATLGQVDGKTVIVGSWVVGETPAGIDIRETSGPITGDLAEFVPHYIIDAEESR